MSLQIQSLKSIQAAEANFILKSFLPIPKNAVSLLSAHGGTGKTKLAMIMADRHIQATGEIVAMWLTEDYAGQVRSTFDEMEKHGIVTRNSLNKMLLILSEPPQLAKRDKGLFKANYEEIAKIGESLILAGVKFAIFDPLLAFYGGNENDNSEARVFIQAFAEWAKKAEITTLIIHHSSKGGGSRGASAFHDGVRARYELDVPKNGDEVDADKLRAGYRVAKLKKDNWGVRKYLWALTNGEDEISLKIMPRMTAFEETTYEDNDKMEAVSI